MAMTPVVMMILLGVVCVSQSQIAVGQASNDSTPEEKTVYVHPSNTSPGHADLLDQRKADLGRLLNFYNYDWAKAWSAKELQSPLIRKDGIFRFHYVGLSECCETFTALIPLSGGTIRIIPLSYGMVGPGKPKEDPHNIAIFNEVISREQPTIRSDADRVNLAILYLHFFYEDPMVLDKTNLDAFVGVHRKASVGLVPSVVDKPDGAFDIELVQKVGKYGPYLKISFSFDKQGMMRDFDEDEVTKPELLNRQ